MIDQFHDLELTLQRALDALLRRTAGRAMFDDLDGYEPSRRHGVVFGLDRALSALWPDAIDDAVLCRLSVDLDREDDLAECSLAQSAQRLPAISRRVSDSDGLEVRGRRLRHAGLRRPLERARGGLAAAHLHPRIAERGSQNLGHGPRDAPTLGQVLFSFQTRFRQRDATRIGDGAGYGRDARPRDMQVASGVVADTAIPVESRFVWPVVLDRRLEQAAVGLPDRERRRRRRPGLVVRGRRSGAGHAIVGIGHLAIPRPGRALARDRRRQGCDLEHRTKCRRRQRRGRR